MLRKGSRHEDHQYRHVYRGCGLETLDVRQGGDGRGGHRMGRVLRRQIAARHRGHNQGHEAAANRHRPQGVRDALPGHVPHHPAEPGRHRRKGDRGPGLRLHRHQGKGSWDQRDGAFRRSDAGTGACLLVPLRHLAGPALRPDRLSTHRLVGRRDQPGPRGEGARFYRAEDEYPDARPAGYLRRRLQRRHRLNRPVCSRNGSSPTSRS